MNNLRRENVSDNTFDFNDKNENSEKENFDKDAKDVREDIPDDEVQLRKHSKPYKSFIRNRKAAAIIPTTTSQSNTTTLQTPLTTPSGRSKSLTWYRTSSLLPPQFGSSIFSRKVPKQQRKISDPTYLSLSKYRQRRR